MKTIEEKINYEKIVNFLIFVCLILGVIAVFFWGWTFIDTYISKDDRGEFGDKFGAINTLFSGLAFAGLTYTVILQSRALGIQREDLKETKDEMRLQRFENTFFNLISLHYKNIESLKDHEGQSFINLYESLSTNQRHLDKDNEIIIEDTIKINYKSSYRIYNFSCLNAYFKIVESILFILKQNNLKDKNKYLDLFRMQLTDEEVLLIFYYGISSNQNFKKLIEKTGILKNIPKDKLKVEYGPLDEQIELYKASAFI